MLSRWALGKVFGDIDGRGKDGYGGRSQEPDPCGGASAVAAVRGRKQLGGQ